MLQSQQQEHTPSTNITGTKTNATLAVWPAKAMVLSLLWALQVLAKATF
jgi:hypothetical protein